ncbi:MAG: hypothetical protein RIM84_07890 [Alphaproteobacteria bacterium]
MTGSRVSPQVQHWFAEHVGIPVLEAWEDSLQGAGLISEDSTEQDATEILFTAIVAAPVPTVGSLKSAFAMLAAAVRQDYANGAASGPDVAGASYPATALDSIQGLVRTAMTGVPPMTELWVQHGGATAEFRRVPLWHTAQPSQIAIRYQAPTPDLPGFSTWSFSPSTALDALALLSAAKSAWQDHAQRRVIGFGSTAVM